MWPREDKPSSGIAACNNNRGSAHSVNPRLGNHLSSCFLTYEATAGGFLIQLLSVREEQQRRIVLGR
jgi:hypothetical protein